MVLAFVLSYSYGQLERDKVLHFAGGSLFGLAGAGIAKEISDGNRYWTFAGAVGGSLLVGLGKEAIDAGQRENGWDNDDLLATVLGGVTVGLVIDICTDHKKNRRNKSAQAAQPSYGSFDVTGLGHLTEQLNFDTVKDPLPSMNYLSIPESVRDLKFGSSSISSF